MRYRILLLSVCGTSSLMAAPVRAEEPAKHALFIAVNKYEHVEMNRTLLKYPEDDAKELAAIFRFGGYTVEQLLGSEATYEAIQVKLQAIAQKGNSDGVVVIGLFGHGIEYVGTSEACFCPYNTTMRDAVDENGRPVYDRNGKPLIEPDPKSVVKMAELMQVLRKSPAGNRLLLADCCRNDPKAARGRAFGTTLKTSDLPRNTLALFACSENEQAMEHPDWGHGAFSKCLIEELRAGTVTGGALVDRLEPKVQALVSAISNGRQSQTVNPLSTGRVDLKLVSGFAGKLAGDLREDNGLKMKFRWCPNGTFDMGSPADEPERRDDEAQVRVTLSGFWIGQYEVTQSEWQTVMGTTLAQQSDKYKTSYEHRGEGPRRPMYYVNHTEATEFCLQLTTRERAAGCLPPDWEYRLPTEAQWEYACRAGTTTATAYGKSLSSTQANFDGRFPYNGAAEGPSLDATIDVGNYVGNPWKIHDMHGNVYEWCSNSYAEKLVGGRDPVGPQSGLNRVFRGGGWERGASNCRSASRFNVSPDYRTFRLGFRVAGVPSSQQ